MLPYLPGCQGQVLATDWDKCQAQHLNCQRCSEDYPCPDCQYWPLYPCYTPEKPMVDCISEYTNDGITTNLQNPDTESTGLYMYSKLLDEGHDVRLLRFSPSQDGTIQGGHRFPTNGQFWIVGCLGITESCSKECEVGFLQCIENQEISSAEDRARAFGFCIREANFINYGCPIDCAPTFEMLRAGEEPTTSEFSNFGQGLNSEIPKPESSRCTV